MPGAQCSNTTPPASIAAAASQRAREGGVALTGHMTEPKWHHTIGSLMQVDIFFPYFHSRDASWNYIYEL